VPAHEEDVEVIRTNPHWGTSLDAFLTQGAIRAATKAEAATRVVAWQLSQEVKPQGITQTKLAEMMHTTGMAID
jgi:antitoxin HicB